MVFAKAKKKPTALAAWEQERLDAYLGACTALSVAIIEHAPEFLLHRGREVAARANRGALSDSGVEMLQASGPALGIALAEAFTHVEWLRFWIFLRRQDEPPPRELMPLASIVDDYLRPLNHIDGYNLHPQG